VSQRPTLFRRHAELRSSTNICVCRRPSAGNLLKNPGFDGSMSGWTVYFATLAADSEGCSGSNSVYVDNSEADPEQCVPLTGGTAYYLGGKFKGAMRELRPLAFLHWSHLYRHR